MAGRRGITCKQLLDDLKETRAYWILKEIALCGKLTLEVATDLS